MLKVVHMAVREGVLDIAVARKQLKRKGGARPLTLIPRERRPGLKGSALWTAVDRFAAKVGRPERVRVKDREEAGHDGNR